MSVLQQKKTQFNAVYKRMHQTVGNVLRTLLHWHWEPPQNIANANAKEYVDEALSIDMHAMRAGSHSTLGRSPGSITFNRYIFLEIPLIADWHAITQGGEHFLKQLNSYKGSGGNKKLPPHRFPTLGIVQEFRQTTTQLPPQTSSPWCSVCPPYGVDSMNCPNPMSGRPS